MGLCRERVEDRSFVSRSIQMVLPVDKCVAHQDAIRTCMIEEGKIYSRYILGKVSPLDFENSTIVANDKLKYLNFFPLVHCEWNEWQVGECSKTCGGGTRIDHRTKKTEEANGGICEGDATFEDVCNTEACPGKYLVPKKEIFINSF